MLPFRVFFLHFPRSCLLSFFLSNFFSMFFLYLFFFLFSSFFPFFSSFSFFISFLSSSLPLYFLPCSVLLPVYGLAWFICFFVRIFLFSNFPLFPFFLSFALPSRLSISLSLLPYLLSAISQPRLIKQKTEQEFLTLAYHKPKPHSATISEL